MTYRWVFFDADGTLFDYDKAEEKALMLSFRAFELPFGPEAVKAYRKFNQAAWEDFERGLITAQILHTRRFEQLFEAFDLQADARQFGRTYLSKLAEGSELFEGAYELVKRLSRVYQLAIITNGLSAVQRPRLATSGLGQFFKTLVISEEQGAAKPDSKFFDAAFELAGQPERASVLVVGDSISSDIQGGITYGLDTCWFNPQAKPPDPRWHPRYEIQHLEQLYTLLGVEKA